MRRKSLEKDHPCRRGMSRRGFITTIGAGTVAAAAAGGVAETAIAQAAPASAEELLRMADEALYRAKKRGRNSVSR